MDFKMNFKMFPIFLLTIFTALVAAQSSFSPARPPAIPLAVRSPYLNTWQAAGGSNSNGGYLAGQWPTFWNGQVTGWTGLIRVDNTTYTWMGNPNPLPEVATQNSFAYTSTRSIFEFDAGGLVTIKVRFTSPVFPNDLSRQSAPVSYMSVTVSSKDGNDHDVQIYTDVSAEWASGDRSQQVVWSYNTASDNVAYHQFARQTPADFSEEADQAEWGNWYYATTNTNSLTHKSGSDGDVRNQFISNGALDNSDDTNYRAINDRYPVFGFSTNYGRVGSSEVSSTFTIFLAQEQSQQLNSGQGLQGVQSYWRGQYSNDVDALSFFHNDYNDSYNKAVQLDTQVTNDARQVGGQDYITIVSLAVRQAWAATHVGGTEQNPYIFMKEISSNGNMNTVDVIYPSAPLLLYFNPTWLKYLLDPVYIITDNDLWNETYAIHDIGSRYPNATGHGDGVAQRMPVEESGNMLILSLAYAQKSGDTAYLTQHYDLLRQWADYLVGNTLIPANQQSTDDFAGLLANQTNLALKGIIAIQAMSSIANLTSNASDGANFSSIATDYITRWQDLGINSAASPPHTTLSYGDDASHGLLYNLYADALVNTRLVPRAVYEMQSRYYPSIAKTYGIPLDTRHENWAKNDWEMWAASVAEEDTRTEMVGRLAKWIGETVTSAPATDLYDAETGDFAFELQFRARPVVGGWFALLAVNSTGVPA